MPGCLPKLQFSLIVEFKQKNKGETTLVTLLIYHPICNIFSIFQFNNILMATKNINYGFRNTAQQPTWWDS
jgi:hypothetical protein